MTEGDKAITREIAFAVGDVVAERVMRSFDEACARKRAECPVKESMADMKSQAKGAKLIGTVIVGAVGFAGTVMGAIATWLTLRGRP